MTGSRHQGWLLLSLSVTSALLAAAVGASYAYADLSLNRLGASATAIGLNAAMPALGWLLATPLMPWALKRLNSKGLLLGLLVTAMVAALAFPLSDHPSLWMILRFLFGGSAGAVFRLIEYWINTSSPETQRARYIGVYANVFCFGAMMGATTLSAVGPEGWPPALLMAALVLTSAVPLALLRKGPPAIAAVPRWDWRLTGYPALGRIAILGGLIFGLFEAVPYTLMPVYALRSGLTEDLAMWTASAFLLGAWLFPIPMGMAADRFGKLRVISVNTLAAMAVPLFVPQATQQPETLIACMVLWGGFASSIYTVALAVMADHFQGAELASANAAFGTLYAAGSLCGPLLHGLAMDWHDPQGLMESAVLLFLIFLGSAAWLSRRGRAWP